MGRFCRLKREERWEFLFLFVVIWDQRQNITLKCPYGELDLGLGFLFSGFSVLLSLSFWQENNYT